MIKTVAKALWGPCTTFLIFAVGVIITTKIGFLPFRPVKLIKTAFGKTDTKNGISPFRALMTALSGCVGVGNIIGVGAAIAVGGAGALFWMWISALSGMSVKFFEVFLAVKYKGKDMTGSPVQYIKKGLDMPLLATLYAVLGFISSLSTGNLVQSGAIADIAGNRGIPRTLCAIAVILLCFFVASKGIEHLSGILSKIMPVAIIAYCAACIAVLFTCRDKLPQVLSDVFCGAFGIKAISGGGLGIALKAGFSRGVFSNEAGVGTSCLSHASSSQNNPSKQAVWGIFEVFTDTILICTLSGLAMLVTDTSGYTLACGDMFYAIFGSGGRLFADVMLLVFAFSTLCAWCFYGQKFYNMLGGKTKTLYLALFALFIFVGALSKNENLWYFADISNALAMFVNLTALALLLPETKKVTL